MSTWYDAGRRIGLHTAIAQLTARKQQLFEVYNAAQIERICDIYDIKYRETEACLAIVQQILEAKVSDTYQGPTANQPKKCPLPRIGSKDWGWKNDMEWYTSPICKYWVEPVPEFDSDLFAVACQSGKSVLCVGSDLLLINAKRFAELLARRDWRRENRGKK